MAIFEPDPEAMASFRAFVDSPQFELIKQYREQIRRLKTENRRARTGGSLTDDDKELTWARLAAALAKKKYPREPSELKPHQRTRLVRKTAGDFAKWMNENQPKPNTKWSSERLLKYHQAGVARRLRSGEY